MARADISRSYIIAVLNIIISLYRNIDRRRRNDYLISKLANPSLKSNIDYYIINIISY